MAAPERGYCGPAAPRPPPPPRAGGRGGRGGQGVIDGRAGKGILRAGGAAATASAARGGAGGFARREEGIRAGGDPRVDLMQGRELTLRCTRRVASTRPARRGCPGR